MEHGFHDARFRHADAVAGGVDGGAGGKIVIAGGEGVAIVLLAFEAGTAEGFRVFEKDLKRLAEFPVLLDEGLIVYLF